MQRTTKRDLEQLIAVYFNLTGVRLGLDWAYGGVRVSNESGSIDLSWRGTKAEAERWLRAMIQGAEIALGKDIRFAAQAQGL